MRNASRYDREWFEWVFAGYLGLMVATGVAAFFYPSPGMAEALGRDGYGTVFYAVGMVAFGLYSLLAWWLDARRTEFFGLLGLLALTMLHSLLLLDATGASALTTATRLLAAGVGLLALAGMRRSFGVSRGQIERYVTPPAEEA